MAAALPGPATVPVLERLMQLDSVAVHQTRFGNDCNNYTVLIGEDEPLFTMNEDVLVHSEKPDISSTFRGGARIRPFIFDGVDNTGKKFFRFIHPKARWSVSRRVELFMNDQLTSIIRSEKTWLTPIFTIKDPQHQPIVRLKGELSETAVFQLQTIEKDSIGSIEKRRFDWRKEFFSRNDDFVIKFPADLEVRYKLAVIVACVFIDFAHFEGK